jgi:hypothetical protein
MSQTKGPRALSQRRVLLIAVGAAMSLALSSPALAKPRGLKPASKPAGGAEGAAPKADQSTPPPPKSDPSAPPPPSPRATSGSSGASGSEPRRPILIANLKLLSLGVPTSFNLGLGAGVNIWKIASVEAGVESGSQSLGAFGVKIGTLHQTIWGGTARLYPMAGTFNVLGTYGRRQLTADLDVGDIDFDTEVKVTQRVAAVGLGNRWFLGWLFFGADWLVVHWPLGDSTVESQLLGQALDAKAQEEVDEAVDLMDGMPTVTLFNIHVGIGW